MQGNGTSSVADDQSPDDTGGAESSPKTWRQRLVWIATPIILIVVAGGAYVAKQVHDLTDTPYKTVAYVVPSAPHLVARPGEKVYRIDPTRSSLAYTIQERIGGRSVSKAHGTTNGIAGDIAVNRDAPGRSRLGTIVANIEQFHSDNRLRDARIRDDFLQSHTFPLAEFTVTGIEGLPATLTEGTPTKFTVLGRAKVHGVTRPVQWAATGTLGADGFDVRATAPVKLDDFGIEHVAIAGLVSAGNDANLELKIHAVDPGTVTVPTNISGPEAKASGSGPSFKTTIKPILEDHCSSCHQPGEVGAIHWEMGTAGDASKVAEGIQTVTEAHYMPPWPASKKGVPLAHPNVLTKAQIQSIADWAQAGGKLDVPASTRLRPSAKVRGTQPRVDEKVLIPAAYTGVDDEENDYRCFVLDPHVTKPTFLTGYGFVADQVRELHHAQVFLISADQKKHARTMSGRDGKPGWQCFGGVDVPGTPPTEGFSNRRDAGFSGQNDLVAGWVPGQNPTKYPDNAGVLMNAGDALVLQIHYHHEGKATPDRSGLTLQLDDAATHPNIKKVRVVNPLAPVEIPCAPGSTAKLCDRDAAIRDDVRLYGSAGSYIEAGLLTLCHQTPAKLTADFNGSVAHSECTLPVPEAGTIFSVLGHMHTLGKSINLTVNPGKPDQTVLLDIPVWNFDWQLNFGLVHPVHVKRGDVVKLSCTWDRSLDPNRDPKYIVFAEGTEDEMCFGTYAMVPDDQSGS